MKEESYSVEGLKFLNKARVVYGRLVHYAEMKVPNNPKEDARSHEIDVSCIEAQCEISNNFGNPFTVSTSAYDYALNVLKTLDRRRERDFCNDEC